MAPPWRMKYRPHSTSEAGGEGPAAVTQRPPVTRRPTAAGLFPPNPPFVTGKLAWARFTRAVRAQLNDDTVLISEIPDRLPPGLLLKRLHQHGPGRKSAAPVAVDFIAPQGDVGRDGIQVRAVGPDAQAAAKPGLIEKSFTKERRGIGLSSGLLADDCLSVNSPPDRKRLSLPRGRRRRCS